MLGKLGIKVRLIVLSVLVVLLVMVEYPRLGLNIDGSDIFASVVFGNQAQRQNIYLPVLMYHYIDEEVDKPSTIFIARKQFEDHVRVLAEQGYTAITEAELLLYLKGKDTLPLNPILITFDDGYANNYEYAFPVLQQYNMKATIYPIVGWSGRTFGTNSYFDWEQAAEMKESGLISFQSHSFDSHRLIKDTEYSYLTGPLTLGDGTIETPEKYEERVRLDFQKSKSVIEEQLGGEVISFAYPYGFYSDQTEQWLEEAGYEMSLTVHDDVYRLGDSPWLMPRISVEGKWSGERLVKEINKRVRKHARKSELMITLNDRLTNLHCTAIKRDKRIYVPIQDFAGLLGYDTDQPGQSSLVRLTDKQSGSSWTFDHTHNFIEENGQIYIWISDIASVLSMSLNNYKEQRTQVVEFY